jgi:hypothetical protein
MAVCLVAGAGLLIGPAGGAQPAKSSVWKDVTGELTGKEVTPSQVAPILGMADHGVRFYHGYAATHTIELKAGESIAISATVTGVNRQVFVALLDRTGKYVDGTMYKDTTATVSVPAVNAKGRYTIVVFSDKVGEYTLRTAPTEDELTEKGLEDKIKRLKEELATAEKKLEELKKSKESKKP